MQKPEHPRLPLHPLVVERLAEFLESWPRELTLENLPATRAFSDSLYARTIDEQVGERPLEFDERSIPGPEGAPPITVARYRPKGLAGPTPVLLFMHSGGLVSGNRFTEDLGLLDMALETGSTLVSVEYRLAPEHPFPAAIEDSYAAYQWLTRGAADIGVDPDRVVLVGESAGGGLAAALALLVRDRGDRRPIGQLLATPMLDHRSATPSVTQMDGVGLWDRVSNTTGWSAYLGSLADTADVPAYASVARATDLAGLPPTFIDVADAEIFRDEVVEYARRLWLAGVPTESHVWTGGCHGFYALVPELPFAKVVFATRLEWLRRTLATASGS